MYANRASQESADKEAAPSNGGMFGNWSSRRTDDAEVPQTREDNAVDKQNVQDKVGTDAQYVNVKVLVPEVFPVKMRFKITSKLADLASRENDEEDLDIDAASEALITFTPELTEEVAAHVAPRRSEIDHLSMSKDDQRLLVAGNQLLLHKLEHNQTNNDSPIAVAFTPLRRAYHAETDSYTYEPLMDNPVIEASDSAISAHVVAAHDRCKDKVKLYETSKRALDATYADIYPGTSIAALESQFSVADKSSEDPSLDIVTIKRNSPAVEVHMLNAIEHGFKKNVMQDVGESIAMTRAYADSLVADIKKDCKDVPTFALSDLMLKVHRPSNLGWTAEGGEATVPAEALADTDLSYTVTLTAWVSNQADRGRLADESDDPSRVREVPVPQNVVEAKMRSVELERAAEMLREGKHPESE